jgi:hypothetical protein
MGDVPSVLLPADRRSALIRETIPASTGDEAEVPETAVRLLCTAIIYSLASADTSGYPLPPTLYPDIGVACPATPMIIQKGDTNDDGNMMKMIEKW